MRRPMPVLLSIVLVCIVSSACRAVETENVINLPPTAPQWADLAKLPDWSGVWMPLIRDQEAQVRTNPPPWTPKVSAQIVQMFAEEKAGHPRPLFVECLPEGMPSWMLITHNALEFLFTPGRVTVLGESDGNRLRRIYTDGRDRIPKIPIRPSMATRSAIGRATRSSSTPSASCRSPTLPSAKPSACPTTATCMSLSAST